MAAGWISVMTDSTDGQLNCSYLEDPIEGSQQKPWAPPNPPSEPKVLL